MAMDDATGCAIRGGHRDCAGTTCGRISHGKMGRTVGFARFTFATRLLTDELRYIGVHPSPGPPSPWWYH